MALHLYLTAAITDRISGHCSLRSLPSPLLRAMKSFLLSRQTACGSPFPGMARQGNNTDIYVKQIGTEALQRLTTDPAADTQPSLVARWRLHRFSATDSGDYQLYIMPSIGGTERLLTELSLVQPMRFDVVQISWSPDGSWLAVSDKTFRDGPIPHLHGRARFQQTTKAHLSGRGIKRRSLSGCFA